MCSGRGLQWDEAGGEKEVGFGGVEAADGREVMEQFGEVWGGGCVEKMPLLEPLCPVFCISST